MPGSHRRRSARASATWASPMSPGSNGENNSGPSPFGTSFQTACSPSRRACTVRPRPGGVHARGPRGAHPAEDNRLRRGVGIPAGGCRRIPVQRGRRLAGQQVAARSTERLDRNLRRRRSNSPQRFPNTSTRGIYSDRSSGLSSMWGSAWDSHFSYWSGDHPRSTVSIEKT